MPIVIALALSLAENCQSLGGSWAGWLTATEIMQYFQNDTQNLAPAVDVKVLHAKIGELTLANDFLAGALGKAGLLASARR